MKVGILDFGACRYHICPSVERFLMKKKIVLVLGIRPDVIRAAKVINLLRKVESIDFTFIWSGQHYSDNLKDVFFRELNVDAPDIELGATGETDAEISSSVISKLYKCLEAINPEAVIFLGDTNTVLGSIAAAQLNIPIIHIEGCMRSYDWRMPEEKCRTIIDNLSDVIYTYYPEYKKQGKAEGLRPDSIVVIQNLIVDIMEEYYYKRMESFENVFNECVNKYVIEKNCFLLATIHRRENVENREILKNIFELMGSSNYKIVFPASYRTQKQIIKFGLTLPGNVTMVDPIGYQEMLALMSNSYAVLTDSGTVVEETAVLGVPSIQVRKATERPQVYDCGSSVKFDPTSTEAKYNFDTIWAKTWKISKTKWAHNLGDGQSSQRIVDDILERMETKDGFRNHLPEKNHLDTSRSFQDDGIII
jgi:UDP-N-acetylglucosamine 2-epimerase